MMNQIVEQMLEHSSVRSFLDKSIEPELLETVLTCGQAASSSSFVQARSMVRVTNKENRKLIADVAGGQTWVEKTPEFLVLCADMKMIEYCCQKNNQGELGGYTEHFITATVDVALMAQNILLAAESMGLGGVFIGGFRNDPAAVSKCLKLPENVYPVFGLCLGWPKNKVAVKPRLGIDSILHQDTYNAENIPSKIDAYDEQMQSYYSNRGANTKQTNWSQQTVSAIQKKTRAHMLEFLRERGFLKQ